ncbi:MAG TPA: hypothetical protein VES65_07200 [Solirubrobacteraceae bacterium]|nr:hypothetical protein [Solirubrobacteraceae bacterium]
MSIVFDANALVVLALDRHRASAIERLLREWQAQGEDLHAPGLLPYEIASALARAVAASLLPEVEVSGAWQRIAAVPVRPRLRSAATDSSLLPSPDHPNHPKKQASCKAQCSMTK